MNKKILIAAGAIVISSAIGLTIAMRASGATATVSKPTYATNQVLDTSSVLSEVSSEVSSAVSSAVSSEVSSETSSSSSYVGAVDNTDARNLALDAENTRHTNALTDINTQYDPQIKASQDLIQGYLDAGAKDVSQADIDAQQKICDDSFTQWQYDNTHYTGDTQYITDNENNFYNVSMAKLSVMKTQKFLYDKITTEQTNINNLQTLKNKYTDYETSYNQQQQLSIYQQYP
jgi:hypothetical protein